MDGSSSHDDERIFLTVAEAAKYLRIGRGAAYEAVRAGTIPSLRFGRAIRVPVASLRALAGEEPRQ